MPVRIFALAEFEYFHEIIDRKLIIDFVLEIPNPLWSYLSFFSLLANVLVQSNTYMNQPCHDGNEIFYIKPEIRSQDYIGFNFGFFFFWVGGGNQNTLIRIHYTTHILHYSKTTEYLQDEKIHIMVAVSKYPALLITRIFANSHTVTINAILARN